MIKAGAGISESESLEHAALEAASSAMRSVAVSKADFVVTFFTTHYGEDYSKLIRVVSKETQAENIVGCSSFGVLSAAEEIEGRPGVVVLVVASDQIEATPLLYSPVGGRENLAALELSNQMRPKLDRNSILILFPDAYTSNPRIIVRELARQLGRHVPIVGAGPAESGELQKTFQISQGRVAMDSVAGLLLSGATSVTGVTQACRPFSSPFRITRATGNKIHELDGRPALHVLEENFKSLQKKAFGLSKGPVLVGLTLEPDGQAFQGSDYVVCNIVEAQKSQGSFTVSSEVNQGGELAFVCRDPEGSLSDLYRMLDDLKSRTSRPSFGLYFDCAARGSSLYRIPNRDVSAIRETFGDMPLIGFHGNFELAPIKGANMVHGYTGALTLIS